ncbi:MAG: hypothetical protein ACKO8K_02395, partial [Candidatus Limnocylindrus sp.]
SPSLAPTPTASALPVGPYQPLISCNANLPAPIYTPEPDPTAPPSDDPLASPGGSAPPSETPSASPSPSVSPSP